MDWLDKAQFQAASTNLQQTSEDR